MGCDVETKQCSKCKEAKGVDHFYKLTGRKAQLRSQCKECTSEWAKQHRSKNIDEYIKRDRDFRAKNPERVNREAAARYRKNRDKILAKNKKRLEDNPIEHTARMRFAARVRGGYIIPPLKCEGCGDERSLHGHHDDYSKPLEVRWLCVPCHMRHHRAKKSEEES